jgi:hypothetical protein
MMFKSTLDLTAAGSQPLLSLLLLSFRLDPIISFDIEKGVSIKAYIQELNHVMVTVGDLK